MNVDESESRKPVGNGGLLQPWLWLWLASFAVMLVAGLLLEVSAGESMRGIDYRTQLFQVALIASALTGLAWIIWVLRYHDEAGGKPVLLSILGAALGLILLTSLFYTVENHRGKRAWLKCLHTSVARGEKLTFAELAPPSVPDDENFAMQLIWVEAVAAKFGMETARKWYGDRVQVIGETNKARPLDLKYELSEVQSMTNRPVGNWQLAKPPDLTTWQDYYRQLAQLTNHFPVASKPQSAAEDVLLALSRSDDTIEALRAASQLPHGRFPISYGDENPAEVLLPHLAMLKQCVSFLQLRASAELQAGKAEAALADIKLMLRLNDLIREEPLIISHLVHIAMFQIEVQVIWQGLAEQQWNDAQLAQLDTWLAQTDFLSGYTRAMAGEKAFGCQIIRYVEQNRREVRNTVGFPFRLPGNLGENETLVNCLAVAIPRGWFDQNKAVIWRFYDEHWDHLIDMEHRTYSSSDAAQAANAESKPGGRYSPYNQFAALLLPALAKAANRFVFAQNTLDFARVAIALERYRLANGYFPEKLDALSSKFLGTIPHDVVSGEPLRYRRTDDGSFILYSIGWNETDDGGEVAMTVTGRPNPESGDWVWRYPETKD